MIYRIDKKASFYSLDTNYFMRVIALKAIIYHFSKNGGNNENSGLFAVISIVDSPSVQDFRQKRKAVF